MLSKYLRIVGTLVVVGTILTAPFGACGFVAFFPDIRDTKFISAADGSTGPAFTLWLIGWAALTACGVGLGIAAIAYGFILRRRDRARART